MKIKSQKIIEYLKIKEEKDLKDLIGFGFEYTDYDGKYTYRTILDKPLMIIVRAWDRKIYLFSNTNDVESIDILKKIIDLERAGYIETVQVFSDTL